MDKKEILIAYIFVVALGITTISSIIYSVIGLRRAYKRKREENEEMLKSKKA